MLFNQLDKSLNEHGRYNIPVSSSVELLTKRAQIINGENSRTHSTSRIQPIATLTGRNNTSTKMSAVAERGLGHTTEQWNNINRYRANREKHWQNNATNRDEEIKKQNQAIKEKLTSTSRISDYNFGSKKNHQGAALLQIVSDQVTRVSKKEQVRSLPSV